MYVSPIKSIIDYCTSLKIKRTKDVFYISIGEQKLNHYSDCKIKADYDVSTSIAPPSCIENSFGTPLGLHCVEKKIGSNSRLGSVFKDREDTGLLYSEYSEQDQQSNLITSRILWLRGLEPGKNQGENCDTYNRFIYIHGSNHEELIGTPQSSGCIEMKNQNIVTLFNEAPEGTLVWIK